MTADEGVPGPVEGLAPQPPTVEARRMRPHTPVAWALVAVNVAVFALESLWGGSESALTLHRMGAGLGRAGVAHEPWRILSAAFLHIGVLHLLFNMWALLAFGRMLELVLGASRFVVLYALCAVAGGLASSFVHEQILSAGASGAVWGLMTGQIALVVRLRREQGAERVPVDTSRLAQPLIVNLLYSLRPGIDMAAHLGGGLVGAALILSGLVGRRKPEPAGWRRAAWAASIGMAASVSLALAHGRPWELRWPPPLVAHAIADTPVVIPVPRGLQPGHSSGKNERLFGNIESDPLALMCTSGRLEDRVTSQRRPEYLSQLARSTAAHPVAKGQLQDQPPHVVQLHLRPAVVVAWHSPEGVRMHTWLMVEGAWFVRLDVVLRHDAPESWAALPAAIADQITIYPEELWNPSTTRGVR